MRKHFGNRENLKIFTGFLLITFLSGCGAGFSTSSSSSNPSADNGPMGAGTDTPPSESLKFCSPLSFDHVTWDATLSSRSQRNFAIALSLTGSFEGGAGWQNITNDFDGQGLSAGLLNQTLGTGSLEPLLANYETHHGAEFASFFASAHASSIAGMIETWKAATQWKPAAAKAASAEIDLDRFVDPTGLDYDPRVFRPDAAASSPNSVAASWARSQLYQSGGSFIPQWKQELQNMLKTPNYVSLQIEAALSIHQKALLYTKRVGILDLRTYLLMFDFVTQNGGITEARFKQWEQQVAAQKLTDVTQKLKALVEIRLQDTNPQWVADVRSRKYAIIDGAGVVHGSNRNLTQTYCYNSTDSL